MELFIDAGELIFGVGRSTGEVKTGGEFCKTESVYGLVHEPQAQFILKQIIL